MGKSLTCNYKAKPCKDNLQITKKFQYDLIKPKNDTENFWPSAENAPSRAKRWAKAELDDRQRQVRLS